MNPSFVRRVATLTVAVLVVQALLVIPYVIFSGSPAGNLLLAGAAVSVPIVVSIFLLSGIRRRRRARGVFQNRGPFT